MSLTFWFTVAHTLDTGISQGHTSRPVMVHGDGEDRHLGAGASPAAQQE